MHNAAAATNDPLRSRRCRRFAEYRKGATFLNILFINAAFREGSRTAKLACKVLQEYSEHEVYEIALGSDTSKPLDAGRLIAYNFAVKSRSFTADMFDIPKRFAAADEIIIAAPFWNFSVPAVLHDCIELICTQGITFDMSPDGEYYTLCRAKKLTYITTAGGYIPENDHAFGYIRDLCESFWGISDVRYIKAEGLDIYGADVERLLDEAYPG